MTGAAYIKHMQAAPLHKGTALSDEKFIERRRKRKAGRKQPPKGRCRK